MDAAGKRAQKDRTREDAFIGPSRRFNAQECNDTTGDGKPRLDRLKRATRGATGKGPGKQKIARCQIAQKQIRHFVQSSKSTLNVKLALAITLNVCYYTDSQERNTPTRTRGKLGSGR